MDEDLSPALGGGPLDWPHNKTPDHKFIPPWRRAELIAEANRELELRNRELEAMREAHRRADAMFRPFRAPEEVPDNANSGLAIEARQRARFDIPQWVRDAWRMEEP